MFNRQRIQQGSGYLSDESKMTGKAGNVIAPYDESELRDALRYCNNKGIRLTISGMRTGLCGGSVPQGGDILSMEHMEGPIGIGRDDDGFYIRVLPCTTVRQVNDILRRKDFAGLEDLTPGAVEALSSETVHFYPVDPTELDGSIGGNIATNASGPRTLKYGPTRDWVRGIRVVLPEAGYLDITRGEYKADGRRMSFPAGRNYYSFGLPEYDYNTAVKNATGPLISEGMDLIDLFIGSEGMFGIITWAELRIIPWHPTVSNLVFFDDDASALAAIRAIRDDDVVDPEFLEYMDGRSLDLIRGVMRDDPALIRVPMLPEDVGAAVFMDLMIDDDVKGRYGRLSEILEMHGTCLDRSWCGHEMSDRERIRQLRHCIPKTVFEYVASLKGEMPDIHKMGTDMSVPDSAAEEMMSYYAEELDAAGLEYVVFGHLGNNHPHVEIILHSMDDFARAKEVYSKFAVKAVELGGSPSAEHGIGKIKRDYMELMYGKDGVEALRKVKAVLDPNGILNIGNILEVSE